MVPAFDGGNHLVGDALLVDELGIVGGLKLAPAVGLQPVRLPDATPALALMMPAGCAIMAAVQCVVSPGGSASVSATTRSATSGPRGGMREGLVAQQPSKPSVAKRSCQRHTQVSICRLPHDLDGAGAVDAGHAERDRPRHWGSRGRRPGRSRRLMIL